MLREHGRSGYFEPMARAGRTEPDSVSIWLKLSAEDAARMTQVLTRPEFAGWTRAEWCLEMIQTALGYYTRPRPRPGPTASAPRPRSQRPRNLRPVRGARACGARACQVRRAGASYLMHRSPWPMTGAVADEPEPPVQAECPHPADARDYQSGTCAACGAILWD